jgi:hypothetical protein
MTCTTRRAFSDSVNLGSNPSSPATNKPSISGPNAPLPDPATYATSGNVCGLSDAQESAQRREKLWNGMEYLIGRLHDAGLHHTDMTDIVDWWAAWTRDPRGTCEDRDTPKARREKP